MPLTQFPKRDELVEFIYYDFPTGTLRWQANDEEVPDILGGMSYTYSGIRISEPYVYILRNFSFVSVAAALAIDDIHAIHMRPHRRSSTGWPGVSHNLERRAWVIRLANSFRTTIPDTMSIKVAFACHLYGFDTSKPPPPPSGSPYTRGLPFNLTRYHACP